MLSEGFLNILKPPGMSSFDVIAYARRILCTKKIGHAGTLDPAAAGVLPLAVGRASRLVEYLSHAGKSYRVEMLLGKSTDSGDDTGNIVEELDDFDMPSGERIQRVIQNFTGEITQKPSIYSAIKINGQRACDLARKNIHVDMPERKVMIHDLKLLDICPDEKKLRMDVDCSKGTYIRSLCEDMGKALGIPSLMSFLLRTRVGDFPIDKAITLEELEKHRYEALLPADKYLSHIPLYELREDRVKPFLNGLSTGDTSVYDKFMAASVADVPVNAEGKVLLRVYGNGEFLGMGVYDFDSKSVLPEKVMPPLKM